MDYYARNRSLIIRYLGYFWWVFVIKQNMKNAVTLYPIISIYDHFFVIRNLTGEMSVFEKGRKKPQIGWLRNYIIRYVPNVKLKYRLREQS